MNALPEQIDPATAAIVSLASLRAGARGVVQRVIDDDSTLGEETGATIVMRLIEVGFVPGERFEIIAESRPSGDPLAVRIGGTCFALRRREAAAVLVSVVP